MTERERPAAARWERETGAALDRLIELCVFGRKPIGGVPRYSADEAAAELVIARLNRPPLRWACMGDGDQWMFHWRRPLRPAVPEGSERHRYSNVITATAPTRPLAICRAALRLLNAQERADRPRGR